MTKKAETRRQRRIRDAIESQFPNAWFFKVHGGPFQSSGVPDLVGCVDSIFFAFEVKEPDGEPSEIQLETIADIRKAGGVSAIIETSDEALEIIRSARRLSKGSGSVRRSEAWVRLVLRTALGEDMDRFGPD